MESLKKLLICPLLIISPVGCGRIRSSKSSTPKSSSPEEIVQNSESLQLVLVGCSESEVRTELIKRGFAEASSRKTAGLKIRMNPRTEVEDFGIRDYSSFSTRSRDGWVTRIITVFCLFERDRVAEVKTRTEFIGP